MVAISRQATDEPTGSNFVRTCGEAQKAAPRMQNPDG